MELRSRNELNDQVSNRQSSGVVYDLMNIKPELLDSQKLSLIGKRPPGSRILDSISFDGAAVHAKQSHCDTPL
jgi:hypothetical protein